ncbi:MAG TPA: hypothetical protein VGI14_00340 [Casimicrobiaceae bacterium]|jgi:hypothetical protein
MKSYQATYTKFRIAAAVVALAIAAGLLEAMTSGFLHPDPQTVAARRDWIAAEADQAARARALADGEVKSVSAASEPRI